MTARQLEVLRELERIARNNAGRRIAPMDLGGRDCSHHSATLAQLCKKGLASRRKPVFYGDCSCKCGADAMFGHRCRGSFSYDITQAGKDVLIEKLKSEAVPETKPEPISA